MVKILLSEANGLLEDMASDDNISRNSSLTSRIPIQLEYNSIPSQLDGLQYQASIISIPSGRFITSLNNKGDINVTKPLANITIKCPMRDGVLLQDDNIEKRI